MSPWTDAERNAVFQPLRHPEGDWQPTVIRPENCLFFAADGTRLHGWYVPHPRPRATVLFCHGNAGNITLLAEWLAVLNRRHGLSVMAFDYRGYGCSEGEPSEEGILQDARAARDWLAQREHIPATAIVLMGQSLGGAVAVDLATKDGARGLVVMSSFTSLPDVATDHMPWLPARLVMDMRLESVEKLKSYSGGPLLVSHGDADEVIPVEHGERLFAAAKCQKWLVTTPGGRHNDPPSEEFHATLDQFLYSLPPIAAVWQPGQR
jgi:fermentation-respiration switch protein FrsA (DUF1100 family)